MWVTLDIKWFSQLEIKWDWNYITKDRKRHLTNSKRCTFSNKLFQNTGQCLLFRCQVYRIDWTLSRWPCWMWWTNMETSPGITAFKQIQGALYQIFHIAIFRNLNSIFLILNLCNATRYCKPLIFLTINFYWVNGRSLKYKRLHHHVATILGLDSLKSKSIKYCAFHWIRNPEKMILKKLMYLTILYIHLCCLNWTLFQGVQGVV